jgi:type II secretory pathway pseudopilin PulG
VNFTRAGALLRIAPPAPDFALFKEIDFSTLPRMREDRRAGWSIVELAIVLVIIAILAALAIPLFSVILKKSRFSTLASDLRTHAAAFRTHALEQGTYPASHGTVGTFVPGMEDALSHKWTEPTPVGGGYSWVLEQGGNAYVRINETAAAPYAVNVMDLVRLDEQIDDGNLASGYLQVAGLSIRYYVVLSDD